MPRWLLRWILYVLGLLLTAYLVPGFDLKILGAIVGSIVLGIVNAIIRPVILLLTLPINIVTLGLFTLVVNGLMLWLTSAVVKGFDIHSFGAAVLAALVLSIISFFTNLLVKD
ncbi:MAG: phage holin family protein [Syntrophomonadaceae bacterium]|nr:phage holin family protein [Syntrophomonadaceae bacterium]